MPIYQFDRTDAEVRTDTIERIFRFSERPDHLDFNGVRYFRREISGTAKMGDQWRKMAGTP